MFKLITLLFTSSMTAMAGAAVSPALPEIQKFFQEVPNSQLLVRLMLTIPALFTAIAAPFAGIIIDRFGRKNLLLISLIIYGIAGSSAFALSSLYHILIARALLGVGVAGISTTSTTLIADYYHGAKRSQIMGIQSAFMGLGGVLFVTLGGFLTDISWHFPFLIYLTGLAIFPLVILAINEPLSMTENNSVETEAIETEINSIDNQVKITIIFIYILMFLTVVAFYMIPVQIPFYLQNNFQVSNSQIGMALGCSNLSIGISSMIYGKIKTRFSFPGVLILLYLSMGIGFAIIFGARSYSMLLLGLTFSGLGLGLLFPNMNVWLNAKSPVAFRGKVLGGLVTCAFSGQFFSPIFVQPLVAKSGMGSSFGIVGAMMLIFVVILIGGSFTGKYSISKS